MRINFWNCKYHEYHEYPDLRIYMCTHPKNDNYSCLLDNKWCDSVDDCKLLDETEEEASDHEPID